MTKSPNALLSKEERSDLERDSVHKIQAFREILKNMEEVTDWEISLTLQDSFSIEVRERSIEECDQSESAQFSVRIYVGDRSGTATCLGTQEADWRFAATTALQMAKMAQEDRYAGLPDKKYFQQKVSALSLESSESLTQKEILEHVRAGEALALAGVEEGILQSDGSSGSAQYQFCVRANSRGLFSFIPSTVYSHAISLIAHSNQGSDSEWAGQNNRRWESLWTSSKLADLAQQRALAQRERGTIPSGDYPIIFTHRCSYTLLKHIFSALTGRAQYLKSTFLLDFVGKAVFPEWVTLSDDPHLEFGLGSTPIDSDGLPTQPQVLIENGIVKQYILSHYSAQRLGLDPNGLASGLCNPIMSTNAASLEELLALYPKCLVIDSVNGTGVNISQGTYSRGVEGFYYENGQRLFALKETTVATSLLPFYLSLQAHAPTYEPDASWRVGSLAFPSIRVSCG